jgi:hypothetical protein
MMFNFYFRLKEDISRYGFRSAFLGISYRIIRKFIAFEVWSVLLNDRDNIKRPVQNEDETLDFKIASEQDLKWLLDNKKDIVDKHLLDNYNRGDICLLNYSGGTFAGYTHATVNGHAVLDNFIELALPDDMIYNYAGLTIPEFRGRKHHSIRHFELMNTDPCKDKKSILAYVNFDNFAAIRGGLKGGRYLIGYIVSYGLRKKKHVKLTKGIKRYGIQLKRVLA